MLESATTPQEKQEAETLIGVFDLILEAQRTRDAEIVQDQHVCHEKLCVGCEIIDIILNNQKQNESN